MRIIFPNKQKSSFFHKFIALFPGITFFCSSISPVLSFILARSLRFPGPQFFLGLSLYGIKQSYFWQFFTYPLISSSTTIFSTSFLIKNALITLILRYALKTITIHLGSKKTFIFLFSNIFITGMFSWLCMLLTKNLSIFYSPIFLIIALLNIYIALIPNQVIRVRLPVPPIKIKWIYLIVLGFIFLYYSSHRNFINLGAGLISFLTSTIFCLFLNISDPFLKDLDLHNRIKTVKIKVIRKNKK